MSKYGNRKTIEDGIPFDSIKEYARYCELSMLERAGQINNLQRQVKFTLIPSQREPDIEGKRGRLIERECSYVADFVYEQGGERIVEDTKGFRTKEYIIKRKLMLWVHGIRVREV